MELPSPVNNFSHDFYSVFFLPLEIKRRSMAQNVFDSVRPFFWVLKFFGFAFYSINPKNLEVSFTSSDAIFLTVHLLIVATFNCMYFDILFVLDIHGSSIIMNQFPKIVYLSFIAFTLTKVWIFGHRKEFGELIRIIQEVDEDLKSLGFKFDYENHKNLIIKLIFLTNFIKFISIVALYLSLWYYNNKVSVKMMMFTSYGFYSNLIIVSKFLILVCGVRERYKTMKEVLR